MRDYKLEPSVWGGDKKCEHKWGTELKKKTADNYNQDFNERYGNASGQRKQEQSSYGEIKQGQFCSLCSAWRGCLGLEPTFQLYLDHLLFVMDECRRVLKKSGSLWVNLSDSYGGLQGKQQGWPDSKLSKSVLPYKVRENHDYSKSLIGIPARFKIAMIDSGWINFNEIIWAKQILLPENHTLGSVMPTSVKSRFNQSFEYLFAFAKSKNNTCWKDTWNGEGITFKKPCKERVLTGFGRRGQPQYDYRWFGLDNYFDLDSVRIKNTTPNFQLQKRIEYDINKQGGKLQSEKIQTGAFGHTDNYLDNKFNNYQGKFTGFDKEAEKYGSPRARSQRFKHKISEEEPKFPHKEGRLNNYDHPQGKNVPTVWQLNPEPNDMPHFATFPQSLCVKPILAGCPEGGLVLDPFAGLSTTGIVALKLNRQFIGFDLSESYIAIGNRKLEEIARQTKIKI